MLIQGATSEDGRLQDIRVEHGRVADMGRLLARPDESVLEARGGVLLPGLHDQHMHVAALAASLTSVRCGPPEVMDADAFAACLRRPGSGWLRATGYHESVAGMLDAGLLDCIVPTRPLRVQHRSGRMWFFNSVGLDTMLSRAAAPSALERINGRFTGRLFDGDTWLRQTLGSEPPSFSAVGSMLGRVGVTGLTDMSPANDARMATHFAAEMRTQSLPQGVMLAGTLSLSDRDMAMDMQLGPAKLHLHEAHLPPLDEVVHFVRAAHEAGRPVAVHAATEVELVYALSAVSEAGAMAGDRIEHASIAPDSAVSEISRMGLTVVTQPQFVHERGDRYRADVHEGAWPHLYRLRAFLNAGVSLGGGSDAPFGGFDPWAAMAAAVSRRTRGGARMGESEALTPEQALDMYLRDPADISRRRRLVVGMVADLCLLDRPWMEARHSLCATRVVACFIRGHRVFDRDAKNALPH